MKWMKTLKLLWWQVGLLKLSMISLGIILGMVYYEKLIAWIPLFLLFFIASALYLVYAWWEQ